MRIAFGLPVTVLLVAAVLELVAGVARAALVVVDLVPQSDDRLVLRDTGTSLDWLRLPATLGRSFSEIAGGYGGYTTEQGFHQATEQEILTLWHSAGLTNVNLSGNALFSLDFASASAFVDLLGCTSGCPNDPRANGVFKLTLTQAFAGYSELMLLPFELSGPLGRITGASTLFREQELDAGHYLVRAAPEPGVAPLVSAGATATIALRCLRRRRV